MQEPLERKYLDRTGGYSGARDVMRVVGPLMMIVGAIFLLVGIGSFFQSLNGFGSSSGGLSSSIPMPNEFHSVDRSGFGPPSYFWCAFVGMPLLGIGGAITKFAYMGTVARYVSNEIAPVGKDVVNYMAEGSQESVRTLTRSIAVGLREGMSGTHGNGTMVHCPACGTANQVGSKFCDQCGKPLTIVCRGCGASNEADSTFCDQCGKALA